MTPTERLRERLEKFMAREVKRSVECPTCHGAGEVVRTKPMTNSDVERALGLGNNAISGFRRGSKVYFDTAMRLTEWLNQQEKGAPARDTEEEGRIERARDILNRRDAEISRAESARVRQLREVSNAAAAKAGVDAINRPLQMNGG